MNFFDLEQHSLFFPNKKRNFSLLGVDEVGRGPLAGPVVACACSISASSEDEIVLLLKEFQSLNVQDSKLLTSSKRKKILQHFGELFYFEKNNGPQRDEEIYSFSKKINCFSIPFEIGVCEISAQLIDQINIFQASLMAMKVAVEKLYFPKNEGLLLVDGKFTPSFEDYPHLKSVPIIKGDQKSLLIALASIVAKEYRDNLMEQWDSIYPSYGLAKHAGYPTKMHKEMILKNGVSKIHRKSFKGVKEFF